LKFIRTIRLLTAPPSFEVWKKNTCWSVVPFHPGDTATPSRPPSPPVVTLYGTVPTAVRTPRWVSR
jgi:hypothetical protein